MLASKPQRGFTLMELMIALGLLGALMAVAWSLLGTFRDAEMRGWKLSFRTQTIRSARSWLERDLQHLLLVELPDPAAPATRGIARPSANRSSFEGSPMGFTAMISPSIDPIPFLGNLMSESGEKNPAEVEDALASGEEFGGSTVSTSPWPAESLQIEYALVPMPAGRSSQSVAPQLLRDGSSDTTQYSLVRRERMDARNQTATVAAADRALTAQDLYRQSEEDGIANASPINEVRLDGLMHPQFRYFDGLAWANQWSSVQRGGLPRAVAFGFDFPPVSEIRNPSEQEPDVETENEPLETSPWSEPDGTGRLNDPELETDSVRSGGGGQGLMSSSTSEVQLVIFVAGGVAPKGGPANASVAGRSP